ncbi:putative leucine-rich repeat-containing protein DDB_G0290503 [Periplaneta americana]|uniref:putative leucine-rich repeat-containing protein DDB_G0290503 n=1 Tax=Periplaneta americana TaxID=6978 RepID=UPI0037E891A8
MLMLAQVHSSRALPAPLQLAMNWVGGFGSMFAMADGDIYEKKADVSLFQDNLQASKMTETDLQREKFQLHRNLLELSRNVSQQLFMTGDSFDHITVEIEERLVNIMTTLDDVNQDLREIFNHIYISLSNRNQIQIRPFYSSARDLEELPELQNTSIKETVTRKEREANPWEYLAGNITDLQEQLQNLKLNVSIDNEELRKLFRSLVQDLRDVDKEMKYYLQNIQNNRLDKDQMNNTGTIIYDYGNLTDVISNFQEKIKSIKNNFTNTHLSLQVKLDEIHAYVESNYSKLLKYLEQTNINLSDYKQEIYDKIKENYVNVTKLINLLQGNLHDLQLNLTKSENLQLMLFNISDYLNNKNNDLQNQLDSLHGNLSITQDYLNHTYDELSKIKEDFEDKLFIIRSNISSGNEELQKKLQNLREYVTYIDHELYDRVTDVQNNSNYQIQELQEMIQRLHANLTNRDKELLELLLIYSNSTDENERFKENVK